MYQAQSYYSVLLKHRFNITEMRILLKIVQRGKLVTSKKGKYSDFIARAYNIDGLNMNFAIPVQELIGTRTHNYSRLKKAITDLQQGWIVQYYDKTKKKWFSTPVIYNCILEEGEGILKFSCAQWLMEYILDFSNGGFREYDFETAMSMRNPFSARLYLLTCSMTRAMTYNLSGLYEMFGLDIKKTRIYDFERRVLKPAMEEMEAKQSNGFKYEIIRQYKDKPKSPAVAVKLIPVKREAKSKNIGEQLNEVRQTVPDSIIAYLARNLQFSFKEISSAKKIIAEYCSCKGWEMDFQSIVENARKKRARHGYIIAGMKKYIEKCKAKGPAE